MGHKNIFRSQKQHELSGERNLCLIQTFSNKILLWIFQKPMENTFKIMLSNMPQMMSVI